MSLASNTAGTWRNKRDWEDYFSEQEGLGGCRCGTSRQQNTTPREVRKERKPNTHSPKECDREQGSRGRIHTDGFPAQGNKPE